MRAKNYEEPLVLLWVQVLSLKYAATQFRK